MAKHLIFPLHQLQEYVKNVLIASNVKKTEAALAAEIILSADLRGIASHGITRLYTYYVDKILAGTISSRSRISVLRETQATLALDGHNGLGQINGFTAMQLCIQKGKETGLAFATVCNSNHFGIAGYYAMMALQANMIGICLTNSQPLVAPTHGRSAIIGTNPIAVAVPAGNSQLPFVLDMATSVVPIGKISISEKAKQPIPLGWGIDNQGIITQSPSSVLRGGALLPLGGSDLLRGYKGYGLALLVDILSGVLSGSATGSKVGKTDLNDGKANVGHFFGAISIEAFRSYESFTRDLVLLIDEIKNSPKALGEDRIFIHGEKEYDRETLYRKEGVPILSETVDHLKASFDKVKVPFDLESIQEIDLPL